MTTKNGTAAVVNASPARSTSAGSVGRGGGRTANDRNENAAGGDDVGLLSAYLLYSLFGAFGVHHAYLERPHQGLAWYASGGLLGWGLLRDLFRLPRYVLLARGGNDVTSRVREATRRERDGVPPISVARIVLMSIFGSYLGFVASCLVSLPPELWWTEYAYGALRAVGSAAGIWLVGNMGEETILTSPDGVEGARGDFARLAAWCVGGYAAAGAPVFGGMIRAVRRRRYRPSMSPAKGSSAGRRIGRHLLRCAIFTALLALAAYNHGFFIVNGTKVYLREAIKNAIHSDFWEEFDWEKFREESSSGGFGHGGFGEGGGRGGEYLKNAFDLGGERAARRTLGVPANASHAEVRSAYRRLALRYHPDKIGSDASEAEASEAQRKFVSVQEAYEVLNGVEQRRKKKEADRESQRGEGGGGHGRRDGPRRDEM